MNEKTLKFFGNLQKTLEGGAVQPNELVEVTKALLSLIKDVKEGLELKMNDTGSSFKKSEKTLIDSLSSMERRCQKMIDDCKKYSSSSLTTLERSLRGEIERIEDLIPNPTDLSPIEQRINEAVLDIERKIPQLPEELKPEAVRNKLHSLKGDERLDKDAIRGLDEEFKRLEVKIDSRPTGTISGGVTNLRIQQAFKSLLKTEQPTGAINGVNTEYTVSQTIFAVFGFSLNGEVIAQLPNYTIRGNKIVFSTALPAAYSGKDFEVKYI